MSADSCYLTSHEHRPLQRRHNERNGASNHRRLDCVLNRIFKRQSKKTSKLHVMSSMRGIHRWPVDSSQKEPVPRKMFPFDEVIMLWDELHELPFCEGNQSVIPFTQMEVIQSLDVGFAVILPERIVEQTVGRPVIWDADALIWRHCKVHVVCWFTVVRQYSVAQLTPTDVRVTKKALTESRVKIAFKAVIFSSSGNSWKQWAHFTNRGKLQSQHGYVITSIIKCGMKLLIHCKASTAQPLSLGMDKYSF